MAPSSKIIQFQSVTNDICGKNETNLFFEEKTKKKRGQLHTLKWINKMFVCECEWKNESGLFPLDIKQNEQNADFSVSNSNYKFIAWNVATAPTARAATPYVIVSFELNSTRFE